MGEFDESKMIFAALKRVDPYAKKIIENATHVALYKFCNGKWEKTHIEGALFVCSRTGPPSHNIIILNRLHLKNQVEPVTPGLDLQLQDPFLLYRNPQGLIFGIWFYDTEECVKIAGVLTEIIKEALESETGRFLGGRPSGNNVDLFSRLKALVNPGVRPTKALKEEFNYKTQRKIKLDYLRSSHDKNYNSNQNDGPSETNLVQTENRPLSSPVNLKPAWMPPVMLTSSAKKEGSLEAIASAAPTVQLCSTSEEEQDAEESETSMAQLDLQATTNATPRLRPDCGLRRGRRVKDC